MANSTDTPTEHTETATEATNTEQVDTGLQPESLAGQNEAAEGIANQLNSDRQEEVPALLGSSTITEGEEQGAGNEATATSDDVDAEHDVITTISTSKERVDTGVDFTAILESLKDSLAQTHYISSKIDAVSIDTDCLIKQVNTLSTRYDLLTAEIESNTSASSAKHSLSKTFLTIASTVLALLVMSQIYIFTSLIKTQQLQQTAGSAVLGNISGLNKKMADYNKNISKALENPTQQVHALPKQEVVEKTAHELPVNTDVGSAPVLEKLNKLRNGLPEKKLIRKETGDWFIYSKKSEECISDVEIIEALNQAFKKIGKSLTPVIPLPAHNAVCLLKPDGKGGTDIVMTKTFMP